MDIIITIILSMLGGITIYGFATGNLTVQKILDMIKGLFSRRPSNIPGSNQTLINISEQQSLIETKLENLADLSDEAKQDIIKIKEEAAKQILETLSKDSIKEIDKGIDEKWDKI